MNIGNFGSVVSDLISISLIVYRGQLADVTDASDQIISQFPVDHNTSYKMM